MSKHVLTDPTIRWLLEGDPSVRWQALRDIVGASASAVEAERGKIAHEGWGARILSRQDPAGTWASAHSADGGLYTPKWTSTTYTMLLLRDFGLPPANPQAEKGCRLLLDRGLQESGGVYYGNAAYWKGRGETCISGMVLSILAYFWFEDPRLRSIAGYLLGEQMPDGGWNCHRPRGATHSSVNTTILVLEGLRHYELSRPAGVGVIRRAQEKGREFLLAHRLFRSHRTGKVIKSEFTRFSYPPRWHYDILRALDYFQAVNAPLDPRLEEAIDIVRTRRGEDGTWKLQHTHTGKTFFELEQKGAPSRWNTLRALRVLKWWDNA
jgi:hypothetical protein